MSLNRGSLNGSGKLNVRRLPAPVFSGARSFRIPGYGRLLLTRDKGEATLLAREHFMTQFRLIHRGPDGVIKNVREGSGLVTNAGVNLMSFDPFWTNCTLKAANFHALGTGATAAASSDVWLQIVASNTNFSGTTNGYMTGAQSVIANATSTPWSPIYQTTATFTCNGGAGIAITEWILTTGNWANIAGAATATSSTSMTGSAANIFTAASAVQGTVMMASTGSVNGGSPTNAASTPMLQVQAVSSGASANSILTGVDNSWGSGVKTWLNNTNTAATTPTATINYVLFPTAWDHKVFGTVTVNSGDTIQTQYQLSINSGG